MKNFLIYTLATITGIVLASLIFFIIMISSLSIMVASGEKPVSISNNSILILNDGVTIPDRTDPNPFAGFDFVNMTVTQAPGLNDIFRNLDKAAADPKIKGVLIENGLTESGWATTEEVRNALKKFKDKSGKFVIAYSDYILPQEGYYLSTIADKIYINPSSMVDFKGLSGDVMFYKKALEKIGVEVQIIRHGKFKGAVEPFMLEKLSKENREQIKDYVGSIWSHAVKRMSESRGISEEQLNLLADKLAGYVATGALDSKLVDGLLFRDQLYDTIKILSGLTTDDKINLVQMAKYTKVPNPHKVVSSKNRISVIYASGSIAMGKGNEYNIGGNNYADIIKKERKDS
ncbi:MAG: S49 family peptidase, partial [Bacteroidia bacterium]|nr:S49 family peptidase [Bacteroidia bacterium]